MSLQYEHYLQSLQNYNNEIQDSQLLGSKHLEKLAEVSELLNTASITVGGISKAVQSGIKYAKGIGSKIPRTPEELIEQLKPGDAEIPLARGPAPEPVEMQHMARGDDMPEPEGRPTQLSQAPEDGPAESFGDSQAGRPIRPDMEDDEFTDAPDLAPEVGDIAEDTVPNIAKSLAKSLLPDLGEEEAGGSILDAIPVVGEVFQIGLGLAAVGTTIKDLIDLHRHHKPTINASDITLPSFQPGV